MCIYIAYYMYVIYVHKAYFKFNPCLNGISDSHRLSFLVLSICLTIFKYIDVASEKLIDIVIIVP